VAFFFLFFLHGFSIGNGQQGISYNVSRLGEVGDFENECSTHAQCFIVVQKFNLQRQAPFLPMQCYAFALFFSVDFQ